MREFCNAVINDGRHVCRFAPGHDGPHHPHINAQQSVAGRPRYCNCGYTSLRGYHLKDCPALLMHENEQLREALAIADEWFGCYVGLTTEFGTDERKKRYWALRRAMNGGVSDETILLFDEDGNPVCSVGCGNRVAESGEVCAACWPLPHPSPPTGDIARVAEEAARPAMNCIACPACGWAEAYDGASELLGRDGDFAEWACGKCGAAITATLNVRVTAMPPERAPVPAVD